MYRKVVSGLLAALWLGTAAPSPDGFKGVTLFEHDDYKGRSVFYAADSSDLAEQGIGNDTVSSFQVSPGCTVTLYEHAFFGGRSQKFTTAMRSLGGTKIGNDAATSVRVFCGSPETGELVLYDKEHFQGKTFFASTDIADLSGSSLGNDHASSAYVTPGCSAVLYEHVSFGGRSALVRGDVPRLDATPVGDDSVTSLRLWCGRPEQAGVTLYQQVNYEGESELLTKNVPNLRATSIGNDAVSSLRVTPGCRAILYEHVNYEGSEAVFDSDWPDLADTLSFTRGIASSLVVLCGGSPHDRTETVSLTGVTYVPGKVGSGDAEFAGHGPKVDATLKVFLSEDGQALLGELWMKAEEWNSDAATRQPDFTTAEGTKRWTLWRNPWPEWRIVAFGPQGSELNQTFMTSLHYIDTTEEADSKGGEGLVRWWHCVGDTDEENDAGGMTKIRLEMASASVRLELRPEFWAEED